jgi:non-canonical purine NTP pyrophosphatase (RdgB/HAM1 family)
MMTNVTLVTGNPNKLRELRAVFPEVIGLSSQKIDLVEPQTLELAEIVGSKLLSAYEQVGGPVIVEDVSAELDCLNGLPGTFIKFFEQRLGKDALYRLSHEGAGVTIRCLMGFYDGTIQQLCEGTVKGTIVAPRGESEFGFDAVIIPEGYTKTFAELGQDVKNRISHRAKAAREMAMFLEGYMEG